MSLTWGNYRAYLAGQKYIAPQFVPRYFVDTDIPHGQTKPHDAKKLELYT